MQSDPGAQGFDPKDSSESTYQVELDNQGADERQYLTGLRLAIVLGSLTLVSFLVLLDMSILGTVSQSFHREAFHILLMSPGYPSNHD
jgi:hypothetical protein